MAENLNLLSIILAIVKSRINDKRSQFFACAIGLLLFSCSPHSDDLDLAKYEISQNDYLGAIIRLNMHLQENENDDSALVLRAICYTKVWKDSLAMRDLELSLNKNPYNNEAKLILSKILLSEDNYSKALQLLAEVAKDVNSRLASDAWIETGRIHYFSENYDDAIEAFSQAVAKDSSNAMAWYYRGLVKSRFFTPSGETDSVYYPFLDFEEAYVDFSQCIILMPDLADAYFQRAMVHFNRFDDRSGLMDINKAIELAPNYTYYYLARAHQHFLMKRYDDALTDLNFSILKNPKDPNAFIERSQLHKILNHPREADIDSIEALKLQLN
jgi:tetratricopeptide (TPR) repeat protein